MRPPAAANSCRAQRPGLRLRLGGLDLLLALGLDERQLALHRRRGLDLADAPELLQALLEDGVGLLVGQARVAQHPPDAVGVAVEQALLVLVLLVLADGQTR